MSWVSSAMTLGVRVSEGVMRDSWVPAVHVASPSDLPCLTFDPCPREVSGCRMREGSLLAYGYTNTNGLCLQGHIGGLRLLQGLGGPQGQSLLSQGQHHRWPLPSRKSHGCHQKHVSFPPCHSSGLPSLSFRLASQARDGLFLCLGFFVVFKAYFLILSDPGHLARALP